MNRETESHFSTLPNINIGRSKFRRPSNHKTTFSTGDLVPVLCDEILPGDTVNMEMSSIIRMSTPIFPVMDNAFADIYFFFVPTRLIWTHWAEFWGENKNAWKQTIEYEVPQIEAAADDFAGWQKGSLMDYFGLPLYMDSYRVNHLPIRAYCKIWNDWFRDENLKDEIYYNTDETVIDGSNLKFGDEDFDYVTDIQKGGCPMRVAKPHDLFTSCLPEPQKGPAVSVPIVETGKIVARNGAGYQAMGGNWDTSAVGGEVGIYSTNGTTRAYIASDNTTAHYSNKEIQTGKSILLGLDITSAPFTINELRTAFQIQKFYERQARGGTRYIEFIKSHFGVTSPDARMQRSEYLGGKRIPLNMTQVVQTSATNQISPQGNVSGLSMTADSTDYFTQSFTEHGYLIGLVCVRTQHTYQSKVDKMWSRKKWTDFYVPEFANIGEQAILNKEINAVTEGGNDYSPWNEEVFGYNEAWAEYRYGAPDKVTGAFRSSYAQSLDSWHYADDYDDKKIYLSSEWIDETRANMDRTLAVESTLEDQLIADFYFNPTWVRPMPMYSIPGLIDHN